MLTGSSLWFVAHTTFTLKLSSLRLLRVFILCLSCSCCDAGMRSTPWLLSISNVQGGFIPSEHPSARVCDLCDLSLAGPQEEEEEKAGNHVNLSANVKAADLGESMRMSCPSPFTGQGKRVTGNIGSCLSACLPASHQDIIHTIKYHMQAFIYVTAYVFRKTYTNQ